MDEHFSLYVSPINLDPDHPAMPISHPSYYATYLAKRVGRVFARSASPKTRGRSTRRDDDATFLQQTYDIDRERADDVLRGARSAAPGQRSCACSTPPIGFSTCSGAISKTGHPAARGTRSRRSTRTRFASCTSTTTRWSAEVMEQAAAGRRADGDVRSRLQLVPPRRQPERVAAARGLSDAERRRGRQRGMAARRGLVADARLLPRADRHVPQRARPRGSKASWRQAPRRWRSRPRSSAS